MIKIDRPRLILLGEVVLAIGMIVGLWFAWRHLNQLRHQVNEAQRTVDNIPQQLLRQEEMASELRRQDTRLRQLERYLPRRAAIGDVVAAIESLARKNEVAVIVPDIKEDVRYGRDNKPVPQTGRYIDIRLQVQAYGDPAKLLTFLHSVEHLSYVLKITDWKVATNYSAVPSALNVSPPTTTPVPDRPAALLDAEVILTITRE